MTDLHAKIAGLLLADLKEEAAGGFAAAKRIPSTDAVEFLDYHGGLDAAEGAALLDGVARGAAFQYFPAALVHDEALALLEADPALARFRNARNSGPLAMGLRYLDLRMARNILKDPESLARMAETRASLGFVPRDDPPPELMPEPDRLKVTAAKAPLLRKLIQEAFAQLFAPAKRTAPGGMLQFTGRIGTTDLTVSIVFSALYAQMNWWVSMKMENPNLRAAHVGDFWGNSGWNYLTEENAPRSIDLLCERLVYLAKRRERIDALPG